MTTQAPPDRIARLKAQLSTTGDNHDRAAIKALIWELQMRQAQAAGNALSLPVPL